MITKDDIFDWLFSHHECCQDKCEGCPSCVYPEDFDSIGEYLIWLGKIKCGKYFDNLQGFIKNNKWRN
jgi:hypothetical protein